MTTPATASSLAQALTAEALTRARRRLLTGHPDPTRANAPTSASLTVDQLRVLADAALLDLDRYATGQGLRYSRVGTTLMLAAPTEQRLTDAIDTIAAAAINTGARVTDLTAQYIDDEKALASVGIDPWTTRPGDDPTGQADRILYVGRDGAHIHVKAGRIIVDAYEACAQRSVTGALPGYSGSWRRHITHSAQMLARAIAEPDYQWSGVAWR